MKTQLLTFLALLLLCISCNHEDEELVEKTASYDVYLGGVDEFKACYWKNGQQTFVQGGENLQGTQVIVDNNDVYLMANNISTIDPVPAWYFWKNGVKYNVAQYLNTASNSDSEKNNIEIWNSLTVHNGDIYFTGIIKNPSPTSSQDIYQHCYWKNGVKTVLESFGSDHPVSFGNIGIHNNDVYVSVRKNYNYSGGTYTFDLGYYKNNTYHTLANNTMPLQFIQDPANLSQFYLSTKVTTYPNYITSIKNLTSGSDIQLPANLPQVGFRSLYFEGSDKYFIGDTFYYKNNNMVSINDPVGFNEIGHFTVKDQNIYMTRYNSTSKAVRFYINNIEVQSLPNITRGCFNSIFVVKN